MANQAYYYNPTTQSQRVKQYQEQLDQLQKPQDYVSKYQPQMDTLMESIQNRGKFTYDVNQDALYNQYKDRYIQGGKLAMQDTMGQAAQLTGGYGNSYANMVGQQAYQGYMQALADKVPELEQQAYDRWNQEGQDMITRYGLLGNAEAQDYSRYQDQLRQYLTDRSYLADRYDTERGFDYKTYQDQLDMDLAAAQLMANAGNYSRLGKIYGLSEKELEALAPKASSGGGGGGASSAAADDETAMNLYWQGISKGYGEKNTKDAMKSAGFSDAQIKAAQDRVKTWTANAAR